ncbi:helix-turn-helix domain-containing protein [Undibacterium sp. SXout11W]|uniref:AraC family transcriptional regulator n=1 Tax=Undibacterium sp. SXout11W TaxID=3413050 RepID=UPI003BF33600
MDLLDVRHLVHNALENSSPHAHSQGQLFLVHSGLVSVVTKNQHWVMPSGCVGWVPPQMLHGATVHGDMRGTSMYFSEDFSRKKMPTELKVVRTSPLLASLLAEISEHQCHQQNPAYIAVLADVLHRLPAQTLFVPMPVDPRLLRMAQALLKQPDDETNLDGWAEKIGMSRRTLTRRFQQETGWSIGQWRQQMRLLLALEKLSAGLPVTTVALDMGYQSVSAFIKVFRQYLACTPKAWLEQSGTAAQSYFTK